MTSLEYLAGFFDGEGCITTGGGHDLPHLRVAVAQVDQAILVEFKQWFGGNIYLLTAGIPHRRDSYQWVIGGKPAAKCLGQLLPYLQQKQQQARLGIELAAWTGGVGNNIADRVWRQEAKPLRLAIGAALGVAKEHYQAASSSR